MENRTIEDDMRTLASYKQEVAIYCLATLPDGSQFNVSTTIPREAFMEVGPYPGGKLNAKTAALLATRANSFDYLLNSWSRPILGNLFEVIIRRLFEKASK